MTARINFEDYQGNSLGYVDFDGKKLSPSDDMKDFVEHYIEDNDVTPQEFVDHFSDYQGGHLFSRLTDTGDDSKS